MEGLLSTGPTPSSCRTIIKIYKVCLGYIKHQSFTYLTPHICQLKKILREKQKMVKVEKVFHHKNMDLFRCFVVFPYFLHMCNTVRIYIFFLWIFTCCWKHFELTVFMGLWSFLLSEWANSGFTLGITLLGYS